MKKYTLAAANPLAENPLQTSSLPLLLNQQGEKLEIPLDGSLGLLALGYAGIMLWRNKKRERSQQDRTLETYFSSLNPSQDEK